MTLAGQTAGDSRRVTVPVSAPTATRWIAETYNLEVVLAKLTNSDLMEKSAEWGMLFGAGGDGGYIFPNFLPAYDSICSLVNTMGMLAQTNQRLSHIVSQLPKVHMSHETVPTPWEQKGLLMRSLVESINDRPLVLVDGVKVIDGDNWALVFPDPDRPLTHVWAEGPSGRDARSIAQHYVRQLRQSLRSG